MSTNNDYWHEGEQVGHCSNKSECGPYGKFDHVICSGDQCPDYKPRATETRSPCSVQES